MQTLMMHENVAGAIGMYPRKNPVAIIFLIEITFSSEISLPR